MRELVPGARAACPSILILTITCLWGPRCICNIGKYGTRPPFPFAPHVHIHHDLLKSHGHLHYNPSLWVNLWLGRPYDIIARKLIFCPGTPRHRVMRRFISSRCPVFGPCLNTSAKPTWLKVRHLEEIKRLSIDVVHKLLTSMECTVTQVDLGDSDMAFTSIVL